MMSSCYEFTVGGAFATEETVECDTSQQQVIIDSYNRKTF